ncbi:cytochrome P450 [Polyangium spumosum]|uniref:Cytochrome P450 n=1 Tax=Polyangium spumosum TaxID=889282 RepID=A0A6N7PLK4_9BACT|nr:cytochrome P450 [Polyangium spumosum]MRG92953.1 cytochrome P450 [Polyangium spumosum]
MERLNLLAPDVRRDPYPHYAELRRSAPVALVDPGVWAVSRYDDVVSVLKNPAVFSSQGLKAATTQPWVEHNPIAESLVLLDPPRHTAIRALVTHAFTTRVLPRVEPLARRICAAFAARAGRGLEVDICDELSSTLPAGVIANLLGFDGSLAAKFRTWSEDIVAITPVTPEEARPRIAASIAELTRYIEEVFVDRKRARRDDLASDLLDAEVDGRRLDDAELMSFMFLLLVAGFETTTHLLTNSMRILAERPELLDRLRRDPSIIPTFVEEVLRFEPPVHATLRLVLRDTELAGVALPEGTVIAALLASANRDETRFDDAERFDIDRGRRPNVAFGHGIHFCLGATLARAEARIALEELVPHVKSIHVTEEPTWNHGLTVRGPVRCGIRFEPL